MNFINITATPPNDFDHDQLIIKKLPRKFSIKSKEKYIEN